MLRLSLGLSLGLLVTLTACESGGGNSTDHEGGDMDGNDTEGDDDGTNSDDPDPDVVPSSGCGKPATSGATTERLMVGDLERNYILVIPDSYDPEHPYPLIFAFHGYGSTPAVSRNYFDIERQAKDDAIFVYPEGRILPGTSGLGWDRSGPDDYDFFTALWSEVGNTLCIDESRVFSTGHSAGGFMTNALACRHPDLLRAIAPVAGGGPQEGSICLGTMPAWIAHGELDETVPLEAGEQTRDYWSRMAGCGSETTPWDEFSECVAFEGCEVPIVWCQHQEDTFGGHWWPSFGGPAVWTFFRQFIAT